MLRLQAYPFELVPDGAQRRQMRRYAGSRRYIYNRALSFQEERRQAGSRRLGYHGLCELVTAWRNDPETAWLAETQSQVLQQSLKDLGRAYKNFFEGRAGPPVFRKKGRRESFRFPQGVLLDEANSRIFLPKLGWMRYRKSLLVQGVVRNATVRLQAGKWFVSVQTQREVPEPRHHSSTAVGIDVGVARFATLSDGTVYEPLNSFKRREARLARYQRQLSRKEKGSRNWYKAKRRVQRAHARIGHCRKDYLHKVSNAISKNHAVVYVEDLKVKNMTRSAAGTTENSGKQVRAKSGLNKAILDQGWGEFRRQLEYKLAWRGGRLLKVPPQGTSQTCPECGHCAPENRQSQAVFRCVSCGFKEHADLVGALNVLARGHRVSACGELVSRGEGHAVSMKQEPTETDPSGSLPGGVVGIPVLPRESGRP